jgi:diadenosine tetraphosphate (Ap4A) HIT family hydrolase
MHVHFHVIPKHADGSGLGVGWRAGTLDQAQAPALAASIRDAMR